VSFIAGAYTATYDGTTIGQTTAGFLLEHFVNKELITGDAEGRTPQDSVFQGHEMFITFAMTDYTLTKVKLAFAPYGAGVWGNQGVVGRTDVGSSIAKQLMLTSTTGTPAVASPASLTAPLCILAEDVPVRIPIGPTLREIEVTMRIYPNTTTGVFFTTT
jgi:hypothetical protein